MTYPNKERRQAEAKRKKDALLMQTRIYLNSESFEEYKIKCAACSVRRAFSLFGLVDPFWFHYKISDFGHERLTLRFSVPLLICLTSIYVIICRIFGLSNTVISVGGGIIGGIVWPVCSYISQKMFRIAGNLIYETELMERGIDLNS